MRYLNILTLIFTVLCQFSCYLSSNSLDEQIPELPISSLNFIDKDEFWFVGRKGKVIHFVEGNETKNKIKFDLPVEQIFFLNANEGWILTKYLGVLVTTDGGKTWTNRYQFDSKDTGISGGLIFFDNQTGWIWGGLGIWLTEDGGTSWTRLLSNEKISIGDLKGQPITYFPVNSKLGWLGMTNGKILKTSDSGRNWKKISLPEQEYDVKHERKPNLDVESLFCFDEKTCWIAVGAYGGLFKTIDGGESWQPVLEKKVKPNTAIKSIDFVTEKIGWAIGIEFIIETHETPKNVALKTIDGGKTWEHIETGIDEPYFTKIKFIDKQNGWLAGKKAIYKTSDGGRNWRKVYQVD